MVSQDPQTGRAWSDRYGIAYGKKMKRVGNVEAHLSYKKLHRTGRLLRGLSARVEGNNVILNNRVRYAQDHDEGIANGKKAVIKPPFVMNGAHAVVTGGKITPRPFMKPSRKVLLAPKTLVGRKMKSFGWIRYK